MDHNRVTNPNTDTNLDEKGIAKSQSTLQILPEGII